MRDIIHEKDEPVALKTEIIVVMDRSGSMGKILNDTIGGYNSFLRDQKKQPGEAKLTYIQFDDHYEKVYSGIPIQEAPELTTETFVPRGWTALYDALGKTLTTERARIEKEKWADLVIVAIITDGEENGSKEYTQETARVLTRAAEEADWKFMYLGANQDSFKVTQGLGLRGAFAANYDATSKGVDIAYSAHSSVVSALRCGTTLSNTALQDAITEQSKS